MKEDRIKELLEFSDVHVLVIGDIMLDEYLFGKTERISPEAPVPVVRLERREQKLGGAANVAMNTSSLGAQTSLLGIIGNDPQGEVLTDLTKNVNKLKSYLIKDHSRKTTCKTRVLASHQHLLRIDSEDTQPVDIDLVAKVEKMIAFIHEKQAVDIIVLQDYNKGFFRPEMIAAVMGWAEKNKVKTILDPKIEHIDHFRKVDIFKPNLKELETYLGREVELTEDGLKDACSLVLSRMQSEMVVLTLSSKGIFIMNAHESQWVMTKAESIVDVSGAGDTVISVVALLASKGKAKIAEIAQIANASGTAVCKIPGVAVIDKVMISNVLQKTK